MEITEKQYNSIIGSLLGDGYLTRFDNHKKNSRFGKTQKRASREYLYALHDLLAPYSIRFMERVRKGGYGKNPDGYGCVELYTKCHEYFTNLRRKWYPNDKKIVPHDLLLNSEILTWWFCDDGTNSWKDRRATIYSQGFTEEENQMLVSKLVNMGIKSYVGKTYDNSGSGFCIDISGDGYFDLMAAIKPYVCWDCMLYKSDTHGATKGLRRGNKSGTNGVHWSKDRNKWVSMIKVNGKSIFLGRFNTIEEAINVRKAKEIEYNFC